MQFIDHVKIHVKAGNGGNGCVAFRREAHVPKGGPSGGDGGNGGSVVLEASSQLSTLLDFRYKRHYKASRGEDGRGRDQYGAGADDLVLKVPPGTMVYELETNELIADLDKDGERVVVAQGGKGGRGNIHFASPWNQTPQEAEDGTPGEERDLRLELKLLADVGLLGYPSVGKSTLISKVSKARPKIADYPFTTLVPNLGVVRLDTERHMVIADIPGLIEGAAEGAGLGHQFLRHLARTGLLLHIVDMAPFEATVDPVKEAKALIKELEKYDEDLLNKPRWLVLNKLDVVPEDERKKRVKDFIKKMAWKGPYFEISALNREGCQELINAIYMHLEEKRAQDVRVDETMQMTEEARGIVSIDPDDPRFKILED